MKKMQSIVGEYTVAQLCLVYTYKYEYEYTVCKHTHTCMFSWSTMKFIIHNSNVRVPLTGSGGGGGGGGGADMPVITPRWFGLTGPTVPPITAPAGTPSTPPGGEARMEMSPSFFLWILMVPCFSSSWIFFSRLLCLWMASSFSFNTSRREWTCELASL